MPTSFTDRSLKRLLKLQDGIVTFGNEKEKVIKIRLPNEKLTSVRAVFFTKNSKIGMTIRDLLQDAYNPIETEIDSVPSSEIEQLKSVFSNVPVIEDPPTEEEEL